MYIYICMYIIYIYLHTRALITEHRAERAGESALGLVCVPARAAHRARGAPPRSPCPDSDAHPPCFPTAVATAATLSRRPRMRRRPGFELWSYSSRRALAHAAQWGSGGAVATSRADGEPTGL